MNRLGILSYKSCCRAACDEADGSGGGSRLRGGRLILAALLGLSAIGVGADERQSLRSLQQTTLEFLQAEHRNADYPVEISISAPDSRLRLKPCADALSAEYAGQGRRYGRTLIKVNCAQPRWQVYVPAEVKGFADVLVADRALPRGSVVTMASVRLEKRALGKLRDGHFSDPTEIEALETQVAIRPGTVLSQRHLAAPRLVRRGDAVQLVVNTSGFSVRMQGVAIEDAKRGRTLRVRNTSSDRIVEGRAIAPGVVEVSH